MTTDNSLKLEKTEREINLEKIEAFLDELVARTYDKCRVDVIPYYHNNKFEILYYFESGVIAKYNLDYTDDASKIEVTRNISLDWWELDLRGIQPEIFWISFTFNIPSLSGLEYLIKHDISLIMKALKEPYNWITNIHTLTKRIDDYRTKEAMTILFNVTWDDIRSVKMCKQQISLYFRVGIWATDPSTRKTFCDITLNLNDEGNVLIYCNSYHGTEIGKGCIDPRGLKLEEIIDNILKILSCTISKFKNKHLSFISDTAVSMTDYLNEWES